MIDYLVGWHGFESACAVPRGPDRGDHRCDADRAIGESHGKERIFQFQTKRILLKEDLCLGSYSNL